MDLYTFDVRLMLIELSFVLVLIIALVALIRTKKISRRKKILWLVAVILLFILLHYLF